MRWAIAISILVHILALSLVFRTPGASDRKYPSAMMVRLSAPPISRGVPEPGVQQASQVTPPKQTKNKVETPKNTRTTEINDKKKPKRQQKEEPPKKEETRTEEANENKSKGLPEGVNLGSEFGSARLDAAGFESPTFLNVLFSKIKNLWDNPVQGSDKVQCTIYFVVSRDGMIIDSAIEQSSGIAAFDQSALRAVLSVKSPPLPNQFELEELGIHLEFVHLPEL
jgi:TonB family protein